MSSDYTGQNCTEEFDVCEGACKNGGTCSVVADGHYYTCSCPAGFTGYRCDVPLPPSPECMNNGSLTGMPPDTMCRCPSGYSGQYCELFGACSTAPCSNHTRAPHCVDSSNSSGYVCVCEDGWDGQHCDIDHTQCPVSSGEREGLPEGEGSV